MFCRFALASLACLLALSASIAQAADLTVSAAASLQNAFREIAAAWERRNPGERVLLNFAASGTLLQQLDKGAPVDVFASADGETMDRAEAKRLVDPSARRTFARNVLVVVVPVASRQPIAALADLRRDSVQRIAIGDPRSVPAGRYAEAALQATGGRHELESKWIRAQSVRQVLDYVARGEVDAGFVYATDAALMKDRVRVVFDVPLEEPVLYPVAPVTASANPSGARSFIEFLVGAQGQEILARFGFANR
ncbi:MAG TPA: molybdate ABC transporter substrate-binding protein [Zeimonas sp.]